ncbi:MAG: insulinase family protein [Pyrinomonadaceae bacterium]|nr:insulinase family protein [Phycisphaerales bacterium]
MPGNPQVEPPVPQTPGEVLEIQTDRASGVVSVWMSNGVLLHHFALGSRPAQPPAIDQKPAADGPSSPAPAVNQYRDGNGNTVIVTISIAGSELLETSENRGISQAATIAWDRLSVRSMRQEDLETYLDASKVRIRGAAAPTAFTLRIEAKPETLEKGLRVARLLLTEPKIRPDDLDAWRARLSGRRSVQHMQGQRLVSETVFDMMFVKTDVRPRRPSDESIARLTTPQVQGWLDDMLGVAGDAPDGQPHRPHAIKQAHPMEVAIVGDIPVAEAVRLGALFLGTLADRPRISPATFADVRKAERAPEPLVGTRVVADWSGNAFIVGGFLGADLKNLSDHRALAVVARIVQSRMLEWPADDRGGVGGGGGGDGRSGAGARAVPGSAYPGFGLLIAATEVSPERADSVLIKMGELLDQLRDRGPSSDEVVDARSKLATSAHEMKSRPEYWSSILASTVYHGLSPAALASAESAYAAITLDDVRDAIRMYDTPDRRIRLKIVPGMKVAPAAGAP